MATTLGLLRDRKEERDVAACNSWVADPAVRIVGQLEASFKNTLRSNSAPRPPTPRRSVALWATQKVPGSWRGQ